MKFILNIILWVSEVIAGYFILNRWLNTGEVDISGFYFLLVFLGLSLYQVISSLYGINIINIQLRNNLFILLASSVFTLFFAELALRKFSTQLQSGPEQHGQQYYTSIYRYYIKKCDSCDGRYEYVNGPNSSLFYKTDEFGYWHYYNDYGMRDKPFSPKTDSNEYRILALGDSFVEGVGTTADSTWVMQLQNILNGHQNTVHYTTMNAGVHGSDLFFSYELLKRCLAKFKPDLVILDLNATDCGEIVVRGDFERFDSLGNFHNKKGPWWQFVFGSSYMVRLVFLNLLHYNWSLESPTQYNLDRQRSIELISRKTKDYYTLCNELNCKFLLVLQPLQNELPEGENFIKRLQIDPAIDKVDITPFINDSITAHPPISRWYWPQDGHFTGLGYGLEAQAIYKGYFEKR